MQSSGLYIVGILAAVAVLVFVWYVSVRNRFERIRVKIAESESGIDVALTKRFDTLTKMLDVCKGYAGHEAELLSNLVKLRSSMSVDEKNEANRQMDEVAGRINVMAEAYPELRSSENFKALQDSIADVEEHLQAARRIYNMNVSSFNQLLASWPAGVVGRSCGHVPGVFFEAEPRKREDVKMEF
ncbi:MAG: LemA family protein [Fretibacterium sp.]|nr:LemA family protein [Fretibacterium sp.]